MDHDAKLLHGTLSADVPVTCSLACWLFPTLYPLPSSAPCVSCIGSRKEGEAPVLPGSIAGWGGVSSASLTFMVCQRRVYRGQGLSVLNNTPLFFGPLAPERSNAWHLTAAGKDKTAFGPSLCQWVLMSALTYKGVGKVMGHHNKKERKNGGRGED